MGSGEQGGDKQEEDPGTQGCAALLYWVVSSWVGRRSASTLYLLLLAHPCPLATPTQPLLPVHIPVSCQSLDASKTCTSACPTDVPAQPSPASQPGPSHFWMSRSSL